MPGLLVSFKSPKPSVPQFLHLQNEQVRDSLFPELLTTGSQQRAGPGTGQEAPRGPGGGGQRAPPPRAWRGGYQKKQFAVAILLMGR